MNLNSRYQSFNTDFKSINMIQKKDNKEIQHVIDLIDSYKTSLTLLNSDKKVTYETYEFKNKNQNSQCIIGKNYRINIDQKNKIDFIYSNSFGSYELFEEIKNKLSNIKHQLDINSNKHKQINAKFIFNEIENLEQLNQLIMLLEVE